MPELAPEQMDRGEEEQLDILAAAESLGFDLLQLYGEEVGEWRGQVEQPMFPGKRT